MAERSTILLDDSFRSGRKVGLQNILGSMLPRQLSLSEVADEYLELKAIEPKPTRLVVDTLCSVSGDREISTYTREGAKSFLKLLVSRGNSTGTIHRLVDPLYVSRFDAAPLIAFIATEETNYGIETDGRVSR